MSDVKQVTEQDISAADKLIDAAMHQHTHGVASAASAPKPTFKEIWPAVKAILIIVKGIFGLFKPSWKVAIDIFIAGMDTYVAGGTQDPA